MIYLYAVHQKYALHKKCKGHSSYITHIDFSADSHWLQSNCGAYELLFWDVRKGRQQKSASAMKDVEWATWTCTLGWPVQGIWPAGECVRAANRGFRPIASTFIVISTSQPVMCAFV